MNRLRQRGAGLLMVVLLILTVAAFAVLVAASQSGGDIQASDANADSLQALFLAETGLERQLKRFAQGPFNPLTPTATCTSLGDNPATGPVEATHTITDFSTIGLGTTGYSVTFTNGLTTDFAAAPLLRNTQCRIVVTARVIESNVTRTIQAIVDRNLLDNADNPSFDNPITAAVAPRGWAVQTPPQAFAPDGGADGTAPNCRRSAWVARNNANPAANDRRATARAPVQITLTAGSVTTVLLNRRVITRGTDCAPPAGPGAAAWPAVCGASANDSSVCVHMIGTGGAGQWAAAWHANTAGGGTAACPSVFSPCQTSYQAGAPGTKLNTNVTMTGAATLTRIDYWLRLQNGGRKELFVDGIEVVNPSAVGAAYVRQWRDCSSAANPVTCT